MSSVRGAAWLAAALFAWQQPGAGSQRPFASPQAPVVRFQLPASGAQLPASQVPADAQPLKPTIHAALPQNVDDYWFAPRASDRAAAVADKALTAAASAYAAGNFAAAITLAQQAAASGRAGPLQSYAYFYVGLSHLRLANAGDADRAFDAVLEKKPAGYLAGAALLGKGEAAEMRGDHAGAADLYDKVLAQPTVSPEDVLSRLGRAALAAGDRGRAANAFLRVYYEFPLTEAAAGAGAALGSLQDQVPPHDTKRDLDRAAALFGAKRYAESRNAYQDVQKQVSGDDREIADLRVAESDYFLKRYAATRDETQPYLDHGARRAEARYFYLAALGGLGNWDQASILARAIANEFPGNSWADEALNTLAIHDVLTNQDEAAAEAYRESYEKFPTGAHAEHSAWKYGWWAYRTGKYAETVRVFERAAAAFPRSDYRPPYLYWSARARIKLGDQVTAEARLRLVCTDYLNSYYGRLARKRLGVESTQDGEQLLNAGTSADGPSDAGSGRAGLAAGPQRPPGPPPPPTEPLIRLLLAAGLYDDAVNELHYAQKATGTSPAIEATLAWVYHEKGDLRRAITVMRRAYPQWLASGGEGLPAEILQVIFPLTFWDSIRRNATAHDLDPFVVAALIGQESTFDPSAHSPANAWGLMQIVPSTGKKLAASVGIRRFTTSMLTNADTNLKLGTLYFSRLIGKFGGTYYALASYDAGDSRVVRWKADRPGLEEDEFIDDIPFPETQNYVKRILGTAEDYRHLYGEAGGQPGAARAAAKKKTTPTKKKTTPAKKKAPPRKRRRK